MLGVAGMPQVPSGMSLTDVVKGASYCYAAILQ